MKKIALIPIDNRPVCYELPKMIARINPKIQLMLPPKNYLGSLIKSANISAIFDWLEEVHDVQYIIISADTLMYGGLVPSRKSKDTQEEVEQRVLRLRNLLLNKVDCKTFVFSSIMRISNNNINEEEKEYWKDYGKKLFAYSYNFHKAEVEGNQCAMEEAKKISLEIPQEIVLDWLNTRERNFLINKSYIKLYEDGLIDTLVYSKDDCAEFGFNVKEAKYFELQAEKYKRVFVKTGADEIPLTLLSRSISDNKTIKIAPIYSNPKSISLISNYEDISVEESVNSQILTAGATISKVEDADIILYVNNFVEKQGEIVMKELSKGFDGNLSNFDKPYFIADIVNANGADNKFIEKIIQRKADEKFLGYAGWNTTGNTLGSAISTAISCYTSQNVSEKAFKRLQVTRLLDDWAYQANIREYIRENNIINIKEIKEMFKPYEEKVFNFLNIDKLEIEYKFPWNRTFEIEINIK
ncbi:DUF4127 family protein [bacterium]|nr:DUF4127 family protein [bacterium]